MAGFDDLLALEERAQEVEGNLNQWYEVVRTQTQRALEARRDLAQMRGHIDSMLTLIKTLKQDHLVVLLSEYESAQRILTENRSMKRTREADLVSIEARLKEATAAIPSLEAELARVELELTKFGKVLPFP